MYLKLTDILLYIIGIYAHEIRRYVRDMVKLKIQMYALKHYKDFFFKFVVNIWVISKVLGIGF